MMIDALVAERGCVERDALASDYRLARGRGDLEAALQIAFQMEARPGGILRRPDRIVADEYVKRNACRMHP